MSSQWISAQGTVRGNVYDKETGSPVMFANVYLAGTSYGANTDAEGFFSLSNIPSGEYRVEVIYLGYDSTFIDVKLGKNNIVYKKFYLVPSGIQLGVTEISGERQQARTEVQISEVTVTPRQIKALPTTSGDADIAQYLPMIPGIIITGDQGGQLYIRGGSPVQNKIMLDGIPIYNPFHSIGFFSVFETEAIRNVDVQTGGFNAEQGGRISAIVDINTREGNKKRFSGLVGASPFQVRALAEGPIVKLNESTGGSTSFLISAKRSIIEQTSPSLYKYATDTLGKFPFNYTDLYGKISMLSGNGSKLELFGFNFTDGVHYPSVADLNWKTSGGGANFSLIPPNSNLVIGGKIGVSNYKIELEEEDGNPRSSAINGFIAGLDFTSYGNKNEVKYGFEVNGFTTDFQFTNAFKQSIRQKVNNTEINGYIRYKGIFGPLVVEPSLRMQYYASVGEFSLEPRIGLKYNITDKLRFKFAGGLYSQNLISTISEQDVVNLFYGLLSSPDGSFYQPNSNEPAKSHLQKAIHAIAGLEIDLSKTITLNVEPYYKRFYQLIELNRNKTNPVQPDFVTEKGDAYGIDFSTKYDQDYWLFMGSYSIAYVNRNDGIQEYPTNFDRRHNINLLASRAFGRKKNWEASVRWNFGSPFPFTQTQGFYGDFNFQDGIQTDVLTGNPDLGVIYAAKRNGGRLPAYHRLDVSLKKTIEFSKNSRMEITGSVSNAYDRKNIFYFDRVRYSRVDQLPIIPSIAMTVFL
ncbi:MAG: TonB-dependent receptor [Saprospiraceae bacterium]